jgi:hypothetical protein
MKRLTILIFAAFTVFQSCTQTDNLIKPDEIAKEVFSPAELDGIIKLIQFVDSVVCDKANTTDVNQAYHTYFESMETYIESEDKFPDYGLVKDSVKFNFLERMDKAAIDAIWRIDNKKKVIRYKDTFLTDVRMKSLEINLSGNYLDYIEEIGKSDSVYYHFHESIMVAGDIAPSIVLWFNGVHENFDFNIFKNRLWATVFLLRMGDPLDEKIERYLNE